MASAALVTIAFIAAGCGGASSTTWSAAPSAKCLVSVPSTTPPLQASGGAGSATISAPQECAWTAASMASWISGVSPSTGQGTAQLAFSVAPNPTPSTRQGDIDVNGQRLTVRQAAAPCTYGISPANLTIGPDAFTGSVTVTATGTCAWTAVSDSGWIAITSGTGGTGDGRVGFSVASNSGDTRTGSVAIAGQTLTITQGALASTKPECAYTIQPSTYATDANGGRGTLAVKASAGCAWTVSSSSFWIDVTAGLQGAGDGTVAFVVAPNPGTSARTGTIVVADRTFTVEQSGAATCVYGLSSTSQQAGASGGAGTPIAVSTTTGCPWTAAAGAAWLTITSGAAGNGNGVVTFTIAANAGAARTGGLIVAGQAFTVTQAGACAASISPGSQSAGTAGGAGTPIAVSTNAGCAWTATSNDAWLTITSGANGSGNGSINFTIAANAGAARTGSLAIAGQTFTVTQAGACAYSISPNSQSTGAVGGLGTPVAVTAAAGCAWTATSSVNWLTITTGANGTGNGAVNFTIAANAGSARTGTLVIAGQTFTVTQAGTCVYVIAPTGQSAGVASAAGTPIAVTAAPSCSWTATSNANWLTITAGANGSGPGTVNFTIAANAGAARTGTLTIADQTFTVTQAGVCVYSVSPNSQSVGTQGGAGTPIAVSAASGCAWTATRGGASGWLTITAGANGSGNGTVTFTIAANNGASRAGTLIVAGQTFTVTQAGTCAYSISPDKQSVGALGGAGTPITVSTTPGCAWTATSGAAWLTITAGANGSGDGTVTFTVVANLGTARTGTLSVAGKTFTVTQAGLLEPTSDAPDEDEAASAVVGR